MYNQSIFTLSINTTNRIPCHILFPFFQGQNMTVCTIHISKYKNICETLIFIALISAYLQSKTYLEVVLLCIPYGKIQEYSRYYKGRVLNS